MFGYAFLRFDPFRGTVRAAQSKRLVAAPVALALVFIVAQVAQNFFSAKYGLYLGGVVAGTFLFAASPLQRAMERTSGRPAAVSERQLPTAPSDRDEAAGRREAV